MGIALGYILVFDFESKHMPVAQQTTLSFKFNFYATMTCIRCHEVKLALVFRLTYNACLI